MAIDYAKIIDELKDSVVGPVTEAAKQLLADNKDAAEFLQDRAKRVASLAVEYVKAADGAEKEAVILQLQVVQQSIQNELASVAVNASIEARATFQRALNTALGVLIKVLPVIVSAL